MKTIFLVNILSIFINGFEPAFSPTSLSRGRSQSMSVLSHNTNLKPSTHTRPASTSSSSSSNSVKSDKNVESKPIASTSFKEIDLHQPLLEKTKHVSFITDVNLREASEQTHSEHLNPTRHGVRARIHRILLQYTAPVVVGTAIGAGAAVAAFGNISFIRASFTSTTTQSSANIINNEIIDAI